MQLARPYRQDAVSQLMESLSIASNLKLDEEIVKVTFGSTPKRILKSVATDAQ